MFVGKTDMKLQNVIGYTNKSKMGDIAVKKICDAFGLPYYSVFSGIRNGTALSWGTLQGADILIKTLMKQNRDFVYLDHAYFNSGHRSADPNYRITVRELQNTVIKDRPSDRFNTMGIDIHPWRRGGEYILVCPPSDATIHLYDLYKNWLENTIHKISQVTDRPIYLRNKPNTIGIDLRKGYAVPVLKTETVIMDDMSLNEHFENAYCTVTFNSTVAIKSICAGVPVVVDPVSAASPISRTSIVDIEDLIYADREKWLYNLAYSQFSLTELQSYKAWELLGFI